MSIARSMNDRVEKLRDLVPAALKDFDEDAVHDARVATRRLTAAVRLLEPVLSADHVKPLVKVLKKLRRRLGPLRDLDVILARLGKLKSHRDAAAWLIHHLQQQRDDARRKAGQKSTARQLSKLGQWWGLRDEVEEAAPAVDSLLAASVQEQLAAFIEQAADLDKQDPHPLRIAGKRLRYTLELAVDHGRELPKDVLKAFERMQDALGDWHDQVVLHQTILQASLDGDVALHDPAVAGEVMDISRLALKRSGRAISKFRQQWQAEGEPLTATIRQAFDLPSEPKTDRDPSATDGTELPEAPLVDDHAAD